MPTIRRLSDITKIELRELQSREFCKWLAVYAQCHGSRDQACRWYLEAYPESFGASYVKKELALVQPTVELNLRAVQPPATTLDPAHAGALVGVEQLAFGFLQLAHAASVLGRIPGLRQVPFGVPVPVQTADATYAWVGEGSGKPAGAAAFATATTLRRLKAAGITVYSKEFIKGITDATAVSLRDTLRDALVQFTDTAFLSADAAVTNVQPAGILNGVVAVPSTGTGVGADVMKLIDAFYTARPKAQEAAIICSMQHAVKIQSETGWAGAAPSWALPIVVSSAAGANIIMVDAAGLVYGDDGIVIDLSEAASLQLDTAPTSPPTASTVVTSFWQMNLTGFRIERFVNWWAQAGAVQFITPTVTP